MKRTEEEAMAITSIEPKVDRMARYTPTEAAQLLGIHRDTLLKYTRQGWIRAGQHKVTGRRFYLGAEIVRFWKAKE